MEKGMKESNIEGVAIHDVPESYAVVRKGGGEALTGVHAGRVSSREIRRSGAPTLLSEAEGNTHAVVNAKRRAPPRGRRPPSRGETLCPRTGKSPSSPPPMV